MCVEADMTAALGWYCIPSNLPPNKQWFQCGGIGKCIALEEQERPRTVLIRDGSLVGFRDLRGSRCQRVQIYERYVAPLEYSDTSADGSGTDEYYACYPKDYPRSRS